MKFFQYLAPEAQIGALALEILGLFRGVSYTTARVGQN